MRQKYMIVDGRRGQLFRTQEVKSALGRRKVCMLVWMRQAQDRRRRKKLSAALMGGKYETEILQPFNLKRTFQLVWRNKISSKRCSDGSQYTYPQWLLVRQWHRMPRRCPQHLDTTWINRSAKIISDRTFRRPEQLRLSQWAKGGCGNDLRQNSLCMSKNYSSGLELGGVYIQQLAAQHNVKKGRPQIVNYCLNK